MGLAQNKQYQQRNHDFITLSFTIKKQPSRWAFSTQNITEHKHHKHKHNKTRLIDYSLFISHSKFRTIHGSKTEMRKRKKGKMRKS